MSYGSENQQIQEYKPEIFKYFKLDSIPMKVHDSEIANSSTKLSLISADHLDSNTNSFREMVARKRAEINDMSTSVNKLPGSLYRKSISNSLVNLTSSNSSEIILSPTKSESYIFTSNSNNLIQQSKSVKHVTKKRNSHPIINSPLNIPGSLSRAIIRGIPAPISSLNSHQKNTTKPVSKSIPDFENEFSNMSSNQNQISQSVSHRSIRRIKQVMRPSSGESISSKLLPQIRVSDEKQAKKFSRPQSASSTGTLGKRTVLNDASKEDSLMRRKKSDVFGEIINSTMEQKRILHNEAILRATSAKSTKLFDTESNNIFAQSTEELEDNHEYDSTFKTEYAISPFQLEIFLKIHPCIDEQSITPEIKPSELSIIQAYRIRSSSSINLTLLELACQQTIKQYQVLRTVFFRNDKIVDADVQCLIPSTQPPRVHSKILDNVIRESPENAINIVRQWANLQSNINPAFQILLIQESTNSAQIIIISSLAISDESSIAWIVTHIQQLYTAHCHRKITSISFTDQTFTTKRNALQFWRDIAIETFQETVEPTQRRELESQLLSMKRIGSGLSQRIEALLKRRVELQIEVDSLIGDRRRLGEEDSSIAAVFVDPLSGERFEVSTSTRAVILRAVLGDEGDREGDDIGQLLEKHEVSKSAKEKLVIALNERMTLEDFAMVTEDLVVEMGLLTRDRKKLIALVEYVRNRIKECLQEQAKVKFGLERKIMKVQREFETCVVDLKSSQNALESNDDVSMRLTQALNPPAIETPIPILSLESNYIKPTQALSFFQSQISGPNPSIHRSIRVKIDGEVLSSMRSFQDHAVTTLEFRARSNGNLFAADAITHESPSESPRCVCLAAFAVLLKHISGLDRFLLGLTGASLTRRNVDVGPLNNTWPFKIDLRSGAEDLSFNSLFDAVFEALVALRPFMQDCSMTKVAEELGLPLCFPVQFEFWSRTDLKIFCEKKVNIDTVIGVFGKESENDSDDSELTLLWTSRVDKVVDFDLKLLVIEYEERISFTFIFNHQKLDEETVARWAEKYLATLAGVDFGARKIL
ncbi:hypothetical protein HK096_002261, partial [Nowakowskiella sp. JEL0078]